MSDRRQDAWRRTIPCSLAWNWIQYFISVQSNMSTKDDHYYLKCGWFIVMFTNFVFGISGKIICTLKLKYADDESVQVIFFKLSMLFAAGNLVLSTLLLVAIIKDQRKCGFSYAFLSFLSLFAATIHIESNTSSSNTTNAVTFLIIFTVFGLLCFAWFCIYGAYQLLLEEKLRNECIQV